MRHENNDDLTLLEENRPPLPELIDQSTLHESVVHQVSQCVRPSNEPRVSVELVNTSVTPESDINDASELIRRVALSKVSVWVKVLYNGVELCRSASQPLSGTDFTVPFNQLFTVRILNPPETLSVEVYTDGPGQCHPVAEIFVPIPNSTSTLDNSPPEYLEFSSDQVWNLTGSTAVGSGSAFHLYPNQDCSTIGQLAGYRLFTSGRLSCTAGWMCKDGVVYSVPAEMLNRRKNVPFRPLSDVSSDVTKLKQWCDQSQLDPNDPNNAPFFTLLKNSYPSGRDGSITSSTFRLNPALALFEFCSLKQLDTNPRLMLLQLRDRGEPEFRGMRPIPLKEREIPADIFKIYEKRLQSPVSLPLELSSTSPQNPLELVRSWGSHHLNNIRDRVLKQCKLAQQHRTVHDVISEDHVPDVGTLGLTFVKWLQPDRPLRPKRKERKKIPVQSLSGQEVKVIVSVVRAFEIPTRKDVDALATPGDDKINMVPVRPFVEVSFGNYSARTTTASGASPTWNQDLVIPLLPATSDFSPGALQSINSCLHVHLFDEVIVDLIQDEAERETNVHQRLERNWLGSLSIPFSTLYFNSKIEGTLKLYSPPFLLGYDRSFPSSEEAPSHLHQSTYLTLFIMVQPPLNTPEPLTENLECSEAPYVEKYLRQYAAEYRVRFPHRDVKTLVIDVTGKCVCVTRYFRALAPPSFGENIPPTEALVTRFVSMIPSVSGTVLFPGLFDIWLTNDQILKLLRGDCEDHAVLLMCYLMHLNITCWLLLGQGIPDGSVAFVLIRTKTEEFYIIHPVQGVKYSVDDSFSPLNKVYCLINQENIWVNIQEEEIIKRTRFDVRKSQDWEPVFNRNIATPLGSVQPNFIDYTHTSTLDVSLLSDSLEKLLRQSIAAWRKSHRTVWNRYVIAVLRKILPLLEQQAWEAGAGPGGAGSGQSLYQFPQVQQLVSSYKVCDFPINLPFTNFAAILDALKSTGVHKSETEDIEWALAVYIHPFPCHVLSVWIYVATLSRRR
uniref:Coiled-coil and C2 domain-containing protein 2A n=1 Tax=Cacopsylla melanoneura TaxID=428564 RepID=A0A8D8ZRV5_9HEMI